MTAPLLTSALLWAARGLAVFPVAPGEKHPLGRLAPNGCKDATRDPERIQFCWKQEPDANIGITPDYGAFVVDEDVRAGGHLSLAELEAEHQDLPDTLTQWSGGVADCEVVCATVRGRHRFYQMPEGFEGDIGCGKLRDWRGEAIKGIDIKASGGYVVAAPSLHPSGRRYELATPIDTAITIAPDWLVAMLPGQAVTVNATDIPADYDDVHFEMDSQTAARTFQRVWDRYGPNRRETIAYLTYRLYHALVSPQRAEEILHGAARAMESLSEHREHYDAGRWIKQKMHQVYGRRDRKARPADWRVRQILQRYDGAVLNA